MSKRKKLFWILWGIITLLLIGMLITDLEITHSLAKYIYVYFFLYGLVNLVTYKLMPLLRKQLSLSISIVAFISWFLFTFFTYNLWNGDWKTQTVYYEQKHFSNHTIEFQLQDIGHSGYNRRTIERVKIFPYVSWIRVIPADSIGGFDPLVWEFVNIDVNEMQLKQ